MINATLLVLDKKGLIPSRLISGWYESEGILPVLGPISAAQRGEGLKQVLIFAAILLLCAFSSMAGAGMISHAQSLSFLIGFFILILSVITGLFLPKLLEDSDFGTQLEEFQKISGVSWARLCSLSASEIEALAGIKLYETASAIQDVEHTFGTMSEEATRAREKMRKNHETFRQFDLATETWDDYFIEPLRNSELLKQAHPILAQ